MTRSIAVGLIALALAPTGLWADGLAVRNGWLTHEGKAVWGWVQHNGWWRAGMRANITWVILAETCARTAQRTWTS